MKISQKKRLAAVLEIARTSVKRVPPQPMQPSIPGFEQPVSADDVALWVATVAPRISPERVERYALAYDVAGKIARAKDAGKWPPTAPVMRP